MERDRRRLYRAALRWGFGTVFFLIGMAGSHAAEQGADATATEPTELERIVVTGSRIPRAGFETLQPAVVVDGDTLSLRAAPDLATALNEQSGFTSPFIASAGNQGLDDLGQNYVNLLGLGLQRTLTLVNGQRFVAGISPSSVGGLAVDLNMIPEQLIERVELITVGGAPIYGSDAISGTVNVILKDEFEGLDLSASMGQSPEFGDFGRRSLGAVWGAPLFGGRGNLILSSQYRDNDGLRAVDRPATDTRIGFESPADPDSPFAQQLYPDLVAVVDSNNPLALFYGDQFAFNVFGNGIPFESPASGGPLTQFDSQGNAVPFVPGESTGFFVFTNGGDGYRQAETTALYQETERFNANALAKLELGTDLTLRSELWLARTEAVKSVHQDVANWNSPAFGGLPGNGYGNVGRGPIPVLIDNPFLPQASRERIQTALDAEQDSDGDGQADPTIDTDGDGTADAVGFWRAGSLQRVLGQRLASTRRDLQRIVLGLDGVADVGGRPWTWDLSWNYGRHETENFSDQIVQANFDQAVQVVAAPDGSARCADPAGGCAPLNVIGTPSAEAIAFVVERVATHVRTSQQTLSGTLAGTITTLPAGDWDIAGGLSWRRESAAYDPGALGEPGFRVQLQGVRGAFESREAYLETVLPIFGGDRARPGIDRLDFEGALRLVDNTVGGRDTTWTAGLRYRPIPDLELRGNLTESIRAPAINEMFTPESAFTAFAADPCDARFIEQGNHPDRRAANCAAAGIEQPFDSFIVNIGAPATISGNPDLDNERAESKTYGLVWQPQAVDDLSLAVDWFDIRIDNAISELFATDLLNACYDSASFPAEPACQRFARDAQGQISRLHAGFINLGVLHVRGLQSALSWRLQLDHAGSLDLGLNHLFTERHIEVPGSGNAVRLDGIIGRSKHRVTLSAAWSHGAWSVFNQLRWLDAAVFDNADNALTRDVRGVGSWVVVDTALGYDFAASGTRVQLNIDNLFDRANPSAAVASGDGVNAYTSGILGRYLSLSLNHRF